MAHIDILLKLECISNRTWCLLSFLLLRKRQRQAHVIYYVVDSSYEDNHHCLCNWATFHSLSACPLDFNYMILHPSAV